MQRPWRSLCCPTAVVSILYSNKKLIKVTASYHPCSAVAETPRDGSCLSVLASISTIRRAQYSSYFRFRFTVAYKTVLFSSLHRGRPCWL